MAATSARLTTLTRLGFAARGLLYGVVATLVLQTGRSEDLAGALGYLEQGGGRLLLGAMALGLIAYGVWRLSDAAFDLGRHGTDGSGIRARLGSAFSGTSHLLLAWQAIRLVRGLGASNGNSSKEYTSKALAIPGGDYVVIGVGVIVLAVGIMQLGKAAKGSFLDHLDSRVAGEAWALWSGRLGYAARGVVFMIIGFFLVRAGWAESAGKVGGMAEALAWLNSPWNLVIAAGLLAFAMFSFIEARFRVLPEMGAGNLGRELRAKLQ